MSTGPAPPPGSAQPTGPAPPSDADDDAHMLPVEGRELKVPTLEMMAVMGYYEILGVEPAAHQRTIKRGFVALAKLCHPDKGGDPAQFRIIRFVYEVLSDKESRKVYDECGRAAFEHQFPDPSNDPMPTPAGPDDGPETFIEHVNLRMARRFLELKAIRRIPLGVSTSWSFADALDSVSRRSDRSREAGLSFAGTITAKWHEPPRAREMGLRGRRVPGESARFDLNDVGVFAIGAKLLRYILRSEFGDRMQDLDKSKAYWRYLLILLRDKLHVVDDFPTVKFFVTNIDDIIEHELPGDDDEKKKLLMKIVFQGLLPPDLPEVFIELNREMGRFYQMVKQLFPEKSPLPKAGRRHGQRSLSALIFLWTSSDVTWTQSAVQPGHPS